VGEGVCSCAYIPGQAGRRGGYGIAAREIHVDGTGRLLVIGLDDLGLETLHRMLG
jgi:hypothetical protein